MTRASPCVWRVLTISRSGESFLIPRPLAAGGESFHRFSCRLTTLILTETALKRRLKDFSERARVVVAPARNGVIDLRWLLRKLGKRT